MMLSKSISKPLIDIKFSIKNGFNDYSKDFKSGMEVWKNPTLLHFLIASMLINFSETFMFASFPKYANSEIFYSLYLSSMGLGIILGVYFSNKKLGSVIIMIFDYFSRFFLYELLIYRL